MQQGINVNTLRSWKADPPAEPVYVSDADSPLRVRRNADGSLSFCVRRRRLGKRERRTLGQWPELGLAEARRMARQWAGGTEIKTRDEERAELLTLGDVLDAYFDEIRLYAKTWRARRSLVDRVMPRELLQRSADSITRGEIRAWLLSQAKDSGNRANKLHRILSAAYNRALDAETVGRNPLAGLRRPYKERARKNILDLDQLRRIWSACEASSCDRVAAVQLLILTGCRLREILHARWSAIDSERWLNIHETKSDRTHRVFLADLAWSVVERLPSRGVSAFLFPAPQDLHRPVAGIQHPKAALMAAADVGSWRIHDLRATFLTHLVRYCDVRSKVAKVCANHSLPGVTDSNYIEREAYHKASKAAWIAYAALIERVLAGESVGSPSLIA